MNILENTKAMSILRSAADQLQAIGVHCAVAPMSLPQGMTVSLHVAESEYLAVAASVASTHGGAFAHTVEGHQRFNGEVAHEVAELAIQRANRGPD